MSNIVPSWGYALMIAGLIAFILIIILYVRRNHGFKRPLFASPYVVWVIIFTVIPCLIVAYYSFTHTVKKKVDEDAPEVSPVEYSVVVEPAQVTVYAENKCMQAGSEQPELTVVVEGCSFGRETTVKDIAKKYKPHWNESSIPGEYDIVFDESFVDEGNYTISFVPGKMYVVSDKDVMLCVNSYEKVYDGQELKTEATCSLSDAVIEYSTDSGKTWQKEYPSIKNVGTIEVVVRATENGEEIAKSRYHLSVSPAEATLLVLNQTAFSGNAPSEISSDNAVWIGLPFREKKGVPMFTLDANPGMKAEDYPIHAVIDNEYQGNYHVKAIDGTMTVTLTDVPYIATTNIEMKYNQEQLVLSNCVFTNLEKIDLSQIVYKKSKTADEDKYEEYDSNNIKDAGEYKIVVKPIYKTKDVTELTFDNFIAFWDSNHIAREKMIIEKGTSDPDILGKKLTERGSGNFDVFIFSVWMAFLCTVICLLIGYPAAHIMADREFRLGSTLILLFVIPMWMNFLLRTIAMMALLDDDGVINTVLKWLGMQPLSLMNNAGAVLLGMVYNFLPFMVFPIYNVLNKMDIKLSEAAMDLGCNKFQTFYKVTLPLSVPGIVSGITMVFMPAITTFYISGLLGGGNARMFGDLIEADFNSLSLNTWNEGSALSLIMMILMLISIGLLRKVDPKGEGGGVI